MKSEKKYAYLWDEFLLCRRRLWLGRRGFLLLCRRFVAVVTKGEMSHYIVKIISKVFRLTWCLFRLPSSLPLSPPQLSVRRSTARRQCVPPSPAETHLHWREYWSVKNILLQQSLKGYLEKTVSRNTMVLF